MSLKLHFASLSLAAAVDQQTGNLSVFEIVEEVRTPQVPIQLQSLVIAIALEKRQAGPFSGKVFIHLITPDGKQQMVGNGDMKVPAEQRRLKAVFRFGGFPVHEFGAHRFVVSWTDGANQKIGEAILNFDAVQVSADEDEGRPSSPGRDPLSAH
jgi:hypothetical protein